MKQLIVVAFVALSQITFAQGILNLKDSAAFYFKEVEVATKKVKKLWNKYLYGPILIVDPTTRNISSNYPDSAGVLKKNGEIFTGVLPSIYVLANYSFHWNGTDWAMISVLPPYKINNHDIIGLFGHELFHRAQPSLHFPRTNNPNNNHLEKKNGRIYLRLELQALLMAASANTSTEMKKHLTNAFIFRKYRYMLYPGADVSENILELNEGMAEYTGYVVSGRNKKQGIKHFQEQTSKFILNLGYVRTFAYNTIPVYGFLLRKKKKYWNHDINAETNLADYFIKSFRIILPADIKKAALENADQYNSAVIFKEESAREEKIQALILEYKKKFLEQPHFAIEFHKKNVSFNPANLLTIEDKGIVYPSMQATDIWGTLTVTNGSLMSPDQDKVTLTIPLKIDGNDINGDGWTLKLNDEYKVIKDEISGNYSLVKK